MGGRRVEDFNRWGERVGPSGEPEMGTELRQEECVNAMADGQDI